MMGTQGEKFAGRRGTLCRAAELCVAAVMTALALLLSVSVGIESPAVLAEAANGGASQSSTGSLESKIRELSIPPSAQPASIQPVVISQDEANAYLKEHGPEFLPPAVRDPEIQIHPDHVSAEAEVDFDQLQQAGKQANDVGAQVLGTLFKGTQKVSVSGKLQTSEGHGQVTIQDLSIGDTAIPDWLTQALVQNYLEKAYKLDLSKPFTLPDHVTRIDLAAGKATFVRSPSKKTSPAK